MNVFLRLHMDVIMGQPALLDALHVWRKHQEQERARLDELVGYCAGVIGFLRSPRT